MSIFTKIVKGELASHKILEDDKHFAFLEIRPLAAGHTLVIPKKETDYFFDLSDAETADLMRFAKKVAGAVKKAVPCKKVAVVVYGLAVRHAHIHLIPVNGTPGELDFRNQRDARPEELSQTASKIRAFL